MSSLTWPASRAAFDQFLYASVGNEAHGMPLTVLSTLARHNVDPWEEAALLCRLPREAARRQFATMLDAVPGHERLSGPEALAARNLLAMQLLPLLPQPAEIRTLASVSSQQTKTARPPTQVADLVLVAIYILGMFLGGWWFSRDAVPATEPPPPQANTTEPSPAASAPRSLAGRLPTDGT